jgi:hypothetical protein
VGCELSTTINFMDTNIPSITAPIKKGRKKDPRKTISSGPLLMLNKVKMMLENLMKN